MARPPTIDLEGIGARAVRECVERRARVLAHPDIAVDLTRKPLRFGQPEQWNGYVPPAEYNGNINTSARRGALILILRAVADAEREADA